MGEDFMEKDRPGIIGMQTHLKYPNDLNLNFMSALKDKLLIEKYVWFVDFKNIFEKKDTSNLIIGVYPH